jgi:uncharacterized protein (TIGR02246 family)
MPTQNNETKIRAAIEARATGIRNKNVEGVLTHFAPDTVNFYLAPPLQADAPIKKNLEDWFATWDGPIGHEIADLHVAASDDVAYAHCLCRFTGTKTDGEKPDIWFRETLCFRQINGRWLITHDHESVPFYMDGSNKAAIDLKP